MIVADGGEVTVALTAEEGATLISLSNSSRHGICTERQMGENGGGASGGIAPISGTSVGIGDKNL